MRSNVTIRTNEQWLSELRDTSSRGDRARSDLRDLLARGLASALGRRRVDAATIEDFAQDAVLAVIESLASFRGESRFTSWALAIALRIAYSALRRKEWSHRSFDALTESASEPDALIPDEASQERDLGRARIIGVLRESIANALTERQRRVIVAELRGMPQDEIARALGIRRNALYKLAHDARRALLRAFESQGITRDDLLDAFRDDERSGPWR